MYFDFAVWMLYMDGPRAYFSLELWVCTLIVVLRGILCSARDLMQIGLIHGNISFLTVLSSKARDISDFYLFFIENTNF